jgi:ribosomal protein S18 acetylase RimI-like enzyme
LRFEVLASNANLGVAFCWVPVFAYGETGMTRLGDGWVQAVKLTAATPADFLEIVALTNRAYRHQGPGASWNVETMVEGERLSLASLHGDLAAHPDAQLLMWRNAAGEHLGHVWLEPQGDGAWYLGLLTVRPDRQDQGLGRALLAASEAYARGRGAGRIRMTVVDLRDTLIAWYQRRGYALTGERQPWPYDDPTIGRPTVADLGFVVLEKAL